MPTVPSPTPDYTMTLNGTFKPFCTVRVLNTVSFVFLSGASGTGDIAPTVHLALSDV